MELSVLRRGLLFLMPRSAAADSPPFEADVRPRIWRHPNNRE
jgi:hypothetical protein